MTRVIGITAGQLRAARALLGWSQHDLSRVSGVGRRTIADLELGKRDPLTSTLNLLVGPLLLAGVRFVDDGERGIDGEPEGRGVRWRRPGAEGPNVESLKMFKLMTEGLKQKGEDATGRSSSPTADHPE
jgi:transcriptional regulator with XRE-family HTH domain